MKLIMNMLATFKKASFKKELTDPKGVLHQIIRENKILKKGVAIQNQRYEVRFL